MEVLSIDDSLDSVDLIMDSLNKLADMLEVNPLFEKEYFLALSIINDIEFIKIKGLSGNFFEKLGVAFSLLGSIVKCMNIISDFAPDVVIGTGGYVSAPVVIAAKLLNIPTVIQEQNAVAGKTTKLASKFANTVCLAFDDKNLLGCPEKTVITGNPVRASFDGLNKFRCREELGLDM